MSVENVELVRRWIEGFRVEELSLEICDPEIEIRNWEESPITGPYHGHDGVRQWWSELEDGFENVHMELIDVIDAGEDRVLVVQRLVGRFRLTGIDADHTWGAVVSTRQGKIVSAIGYATPGEAKQAAGLIDDRKE